VKKFIAIAMLFAISYQYMIKLGIIAYYELNKSYIAQNLCENRDKPQIKCCGKCYLRKQLKKAEDENTGSKQLPTKIDKVEVAAFFPLAPIHISVQGFSLKVIFHDRYQQPSGSDPLSSIFHPPPVC